MRYISLYIFLSCSAISLAQIHHDEETYFFNDEIDTLLNQLIGGRFKSFDAFIKTPNAGKYHKGGVYSYERLNDTLIKVFRDQNLQYYYYYDRQKHEFSQLDSLKHNYISSDYYSLKKDSVGFKVFYFYDVRNKDTIFLQYSREKKDEKNRLINNFFFFYNHQQSKHTQEYECIYFGDTILIEKTFKFEMDKRKLYSCDMVITSIYCVGKTKTIKKVIRSQQQLENTDRYCFFTYKSKKIIYYDNNGIVCYVKFISRPFKEKASMKIICYKN